MSLPTQDDVLDFWFRETPEALWWEKNPAFDRRLTLRFSALHQAASRGELWAWRRDIHGRLAEILVLDQFSRQIYRDQAAAFACDAMALALAQEAVSSGEAVELQPRLRAFLYLPFMHSESLIVHELAAPLFAEAGLENTQAFEQRHLAILQRFGRYPHRNIILGRDSTAEEITFLQTPGSSF